jgi:L-iditol 2-dehydrogenase
MGTMRAGRIVASGRVDFEEVDVKPAGDGELLVRTTYASICGSDLHIAIPSDPVEVTGPPGFPGHEGVGEVVESNSADFAPGDRVLCVPNAAIGMTFAEYQAIPARYCILLPETDLTELELLMAQQLGTVVFAQRRRNVDVTGKTVVVLGQGSAGLFHAFLARRRGAAKVITTDVAPARLAHSRATVADVAIDASEGADAVRRQVMEATGGRGGDYVIEAVGVKETLAQSIQVAAPYAEVLWFGLPDTRQDVPISFSQFFRKQLTASTAVGAQEEPGLVSFRAALALICSGAIDVSPLVSHVLPIEKITDAFQLAHSRDDGALKVSVSF